MKSSRKPQTLLRWLAAEKAGETEAAEAALREVLQILEPLAPPAGFAQRVLAQARVQAAPAAGPERRLFAARWQRAALAASFAAAAYGLLWLPAALQALSGATLLTALVQNGADFLTALNLWVLSALGLGEKLVLLGSALAEPLATPPVLALAAACLAVSALALRSLRELIRRDRRWVYADPI